MDEATARMQAICKSYDYEDEFYVYCDPDDSARYFVLSGTSRDLGYGGVEDLDPVACYAAGATLS